MQRDLLHETSLRVALIGCGKSKLNRPAPARELYAGPLFRAQLQHAEARFGANVLVLSALHGVVALEDELEPYDASMAAKGYMARECWQEMVHSQLLHRFLDVCVDFHCYAGRPYVEPLTRGRGKLPQWTFLDELRGLQVGERLGWLKQQREAA